jgi:hypothetical protein
METTRPLYATQTKDGTKIWVEGNLPTPSIVEGEMPSTEKIESALERGKETLRSAAADTSLDRRGTTLEGDMEKIIDSTAKLLEEKNAENQLQHLVRAAKEAAMDTTKKGNKIPSQLKQEMQASGVTGEKLETDVRELYGYLRNLVWNFVRSQDFRNLLTEWIQYLHSLSVQKGKDVSFKEEETVGKAVAEGLQEPQPTLSKEELIKESESTFQKLLSEFAEKQEYHEAVRDILKIFGAMKSTWGDITEHPPMKTQHIRSAFEDAMSLIGSFTGRERLEEFRKTCWECTVAIKNNKEVTTLFTELRGILEDIISRPDMITKEEEKVRINCLTKDARRVLKDEKWRRMSEDLSTQFMGLINAVKHDSSALEWRGRLEKLFRDLLFNQHGEPDLFVLEDSVHQLRNLIVPLFKQLLANITIKRIDVMSDTYDLRVEDILFDVTTFLPQHLDFRMLNATHKDLKNEFMDVTKHQLLLQVDNIKPEFRHLKFYYRRKSFPTIEDYGVADLALTGEGAKIAVLWAVHQSGHFPPVAKLMDVLCEIDKLNIHIVGEATKHSWFDKAAAPLVSGIIKNRLESTIEDYLKAKLELINSDINEFFLSKPTEKMVMKMDQAMKQAYHKLA